MLHIYGCDHIVEAFDLAPILGEISGLVCDLEAKTSQNYWVFLHKCSNRICKELFKWSEIWHEHRPIYATDYWLRKFGGP